MAHFYFNPETLQFNKIERRNSHRILRFILILTGVIIVSGIMMVLADQYFQTPKLKQLSIQQEQLSYQIGLINLDIGQYESELENIAFNDDYVYRAFFEVDPWPSSIRDAGIGGSRRNLELSNPRNSKLVTDTYLRMDILSRKLVIQSRSFDEIIEMARNKEAIMASRPAIQPVSIKDLRRFGSSFGMRMHPILKVVRPHNGIDLTAPRGTPIYATADGVVIQAGYTSGGYGRKILLDHGFGYRTLYGHCNKILVTIGQEVKRGEVIGLVGSTGLSTTPHLHYEVHINGRPVNPINYYANDLSAEEYEKMITLFSNADPSFDIN
jgi:hypothetical protein